MDNIRFSIIIPVRNAPKHLKKCLTAIHESLLDNFECIVVDDCSTDKTVSVAKGFPVRIFRTSAPKGPAHARNIGAKHARGQILFFVDADVLVCADTLLKIDRALRNHPEIDAIIGSYDNLPHDRSFVSQYKNLFHHYVHQHLSLHTCTFWTGCGAVRKSVFDEIGGFDESYRLPAVEDIEFGFRLTQKKKKISLEKNIRVKHLKRWTFWNLLKTDILQRGIPWTVLILQNKRFPNDLNISISQRISIALVYLLLFSLFLTVAMVSYTPSFLMLSMSIFLSIVYANLHFYEFLARKRGPSFMIRAVPLHLTYYFYCGLSFLMGVMVFLGVSTTSKSVMLRK